MQTNKTMAVDAIWMKNWAGTWSFLFASFYGRNYTQGLEDFIGVHFDNNIVTYEKGASANYFPKAELERFSKACAEYLLTHNEAAKDWCDQICRLSDETMALVASLDRKQTHTKEDYESVKRSFFDHVPPNFSIKKVVDYLPKDFVSAHLELFEKVRIYTEPVYGAIDRMLLKIVSSLLNISPELAVLLTREEVENFFETGLITNEAELQTRMNGVALLFDTQGKSTLFSGPEFVAFMKTITGVTEKKEIKGSIAYKGMASGRVRIVHDPRDPGEFNEGDILVTGMTRPEFLQPMQKSAAFVTDAGGLLSHATIVAREMKKPCIIGTEIATKVLKNGDMVEVDANKGIVRKL